jgi:type IV secretion system protein VirB11
MDSKPQDIFHKRTASYLDICLKKILPFLHEDHVTDISTLDDGEIVVDYFKRGRVYSGVILSPEERSIILNNISSAINLVIDFHKYPVLEGVIPGYNCRIQGIYPPWVQNPVLFIRKPFNHVITLEEYKEEKRITAKQLKDVCRLIETRKNILICGATGSGKTTFTNGIIKKMYEFCPDDVFYIIEDVPELICEARSKISVCVRSDQAYLAVVNALRCKPNRIIFGEIREGLIAKEVLVGANTGHTGNVSTIHANSAKDGMLRIESLLRQVYVGNIPDPREAFDAAIYMESVRGFGPLVKEIEIF